MRNIFHFIFNIGMFSINYTREFRFRINVSYKSRGTNITKEPRP